MIERPSTSRFLVGNIAGVHSRLFCNKSRGKRLEMKLSHGAVIVGLIGIYGIRSQAEIQGLEGEKYLGTML